MKSGGNYLDGIAIDSDGKPFITEYKQSSTAPYTKNQNANGFPNGQLNQDMIIIGEGAGIFKSGDIIPKGTQIVTIRGK